MHILSWADTGPGYGDTDASGWDSLTGCNTPVLCELSVSKLEGSVITGDNDLLMVEGAMLWGSEFVIYTILPACLPLQEGLGVGWTEGYSIPMAFVVR